MAATAISLSVIKQCAEILQLPPVGISGRVYRVCSPLLKLAWDYFWGFILKNKMLQRAFFHIAHFTSPHISLVIGPRGLECEINL